MLFVLFYIILFYYFNVQFIHCFIMFYCCARTCKRRRLIPKDIKIYPKSCAPQDVFQVRLLSDNSERQLHRSAVQVKLETSKAVEAHVKALQGGDDG